jgi:hypothetical protein
MALDRVMLRLDTRCRASAMGVPHLLSVSLQYSQQEDGHHDNDSGPICNDLL